MKSLLKFSLLLALVIGGKLAKHSAPAVATQHVKTKAPAPANSSMILVHQVYTSEPVKPTREQAQPQQSGSGLIAEMF